MDTLISDRPAFPAASAARGTGRALPGPGSGSHGQLQPLGPLTALSAELPDYSWAAHLDSLEGNGAQAVALPTGGQAKREPFVWAFLATSTLAVLGLWGAKHGGWPWSFIKGAVDPRMLLSAPIIGVAGFAQGLTGFGFGLVAMALLPLVMSLKEAVTLGALLNLVVCGRTFLAMRAHYSWRQGLGLVVGACLGVPLGLYGMAQLEEALLLRLLGSVMLLFSANELLLARRRLVRLSPRLGLPFGLVSGSLSGAFGVGGPPAIAFAYSQAWDKQQVVAVLQVVFGVSALVRLLLLGQSGFLAPPLLRLGLWSVLPLLAAIALGQKFFWRIPQALLKQAAFLFLWAMGLKYLLLP